MTSDAICVLIADDEPLARRTLTDFLRDVPWIQEVREAADGTSAVKMIDGWQPDLVFLDVVMPGLNGVEVLRRIAHQPHVVFTTAHDYALTAFELGALDYLLKPFGRERLLQVLERAKPRLSDPSGAAIRANEMLGAGGPLSRIFVRDGARIINMELDRVESIDGGDDHAVFHVGGRDYLVKVRLQDLATVLDPTRFARIHRSHIVNLDHVIACEPFDAWRLQAVMRSGRRVTASRVGTRLLRSFVLG
jgi:two-component system LytT family response regulator